MCPTGPVIKKKKILRKKRNESRGAMLLTKMIEANFI